MGTNCKITLPSGVRSRDVAKVIGILAGCEKRKQPLRGEHDTSWSVWVPNVSLRSCGDTMPECCLIQWTDPDGQPHQILYHFEWYGGQKGMMPSSTPFAIALARRLVDFYGGWVVYADTGETDTDYMALSIRDPAPEDGEEWQEFQQRLWDLQPLTRSEIEAARPHAAYPEADWTPLEEIQSR